MARACTTTASSVHGLPPIVGPAPTVLILGSMPGVESLRQQQYYAHPRNAFWDLLGELFGARRELPYDGRRQVLTARGIAVWDVARECIRPGSLDSDIRNAQPNDFARFFHDHPTLRAVFFNGQKAAQMFDRLVRPRLGDAAGALQFHALPSTSPAHAGKSRAQKLAEWRKVQEFVGSL